MRLDNKFIVVSLRTAIRGMLRRRPGLTLAALIILALGIGANTALFTLLEATLIHPLPYRDSDRLVYPWEMIFAGRSSARFGEPRVEAFRGWREDAESFEGIAAFYTESSPLETGRTDLNQIQGARVSHGFFAFLGHTPPLGRGFLREDAQPASSPVVVISDKFWRQNYGSDPGVLGRILDLNGEGHRIIGVSPPELRLVESPEASYFVPLSETLEGMQLTVLARLREGVLQEAAAVELSIIGNAQSSRTDLEEVTVSLKSPQERLNGHLIKPLLWLQAIAALVLLITCANVAQLLLAKGELREHEIVMRAVVGADRGQLMRQLLLESMLLSVVAGAMGLLVATWSLEAILAMAPWHLMRLQGIELNHYSLAFALALTLLTGLLSGLLPALKGSLPDLAVSLKRSLSGAAATRRRQSTHQLLVATQVAVSFVLLLGALLLLRELERLGSHDYGFTVENVWIAELRMPWGEAPEETGLQMALTLDQVYEIIDLPDVEIVLANGLPTPGEGFFARQLELEGGLETPEPIREILDRITASPGYFRALDLSLREGRAFTEEDRRWPEPPLVISETLARRLAPGESPVGRRLSLNPGSWYRIVGVVGDTQPVNPHDLGLAIYLPYWEAPQRSSRLIVRANEYPGPVLETLEARLRAVDPNIAIGPSTPAADVLGRPFVQERFNSFLTALFAALAVAFMAAGVYGTVTWTVLRQVQEIGIRAALGAEHRRLLGRMLGRSLYPVAIGLAIGAMGAAGLTQVAEGFIAGLVRGPSSTYIVVAVGVVVTALVAAWVPASRAAQINPVEVLRRE